MIERPTPSRGNPEVRLVREAVRADRNGSWLLFPAILLASCVPAGLAVFSGLLVGALPGAFGADPVPGERDRAVWALAGIGVMFLVQQLLPPAATAVAERVGRRMDRRMAERVLSAVSRPTTVTELENSTVRDRLAAINGGLGDAGARDAMTGMVNMGITRIGSLAGIVLLFSYSWWLPFLLGAAYLTAMLLISVKYQAGLQAAEGAPARLRRAAYLKDLAASATAAKDVRVFGLTGWLREQYRAEWAHGVQEIRGSGRTAVGRVALLSGSLVLAAQAVALFLMVDDVMDGQLSVGRFTVYVVVLVGLAGSLGLSPDLLNIAVAGAKLRALDELESALNVVPPSDTDPVATQSRRTPVPDLSREIVFDKVTFTYPGAGRPVLRELSLTIPAGQSTAIVGVNGAGKSTLVKLLCGLYRPDQGRILVDGVDLADVDLAAWQRRCAVLSQHWLRWGLSARDNVLWGAPDRPVDPDVLAQVAATSGLDEVVDKLPQGWDTPLSRAFGGVDLSGGQWQRVGLARALYARATGGGVLVMDEPTSAMDVRGETELNERLLASATGDTVVLVSHRFAAVRRADRIVVLSQGQVVEQGDHESLRAAQGEYDRMFRTQAERFADPADPQGIQADLAGRQ